LGEDITVEAVLYDLRVQKPVATLDSVTGVACSKSSKNSNQRKEQNEKQMRKEKKKRNQERGEKKNNYPILFG